MILQDAYQVAQVLLDTMRPTHDEELVVSACREFDTAWVFGYDTRRFVAEGETSAALVGHGPVVVPRSGAAAYVGSPAIPMTSRGRGRSWSLASIPPLSQRRGTILQDAYDVAQERLDTMRHKHAEEIVICTCTQRATAWVFGYNTRRYLSGGEFQAPLLGNSPVVVPKSGKAAYLDSPFPQKQRSLRWKILHRIGSSPEPPDLPHLEIPG